MKIAYVSLFPEKDKLHQYAGGVASYTKNLVNSLPLNKEDKLFIICNKIDKKRNVYFENNAKVLRCFDKDSRYFLQVLKEIKKINPDVIHFQQELGLFGGPFSAYLLQWLLFLLRKYKTVITLHGVVSLRGINKDFVGENNSSLPVILVKAAIFAIYKPLCVWSKKIIVHEQYFKNVLVKEYGVRADKISVIPHGIENLKPTNKVKAREMLNIKNDQHVVLFMGYLTGYKGIDLLIDGFAEYAKKDKKALLLIGAGEHPKFQRNKKYISMYEEYKQKAAKKINADQYRWVGFVPENKLPDYFGASDVTILPYIVCMASSGPMSISIAFEKPFLVSDVFKKVFNNEMVIFKRTPLALCDSISSYYKNISVYSKFVKDLKRQRDWRLVGKAVYKSYQ